MAAELSGLPAEQVRFGLSTPVSSGTERHWLRTVEFVTGLFEIEAAFASELVRAEVFRTLAIATVEAPEHRP